MPLPAIQQAAPQFTVSALMPNKEFKDISLSDYLGKWVVFFWYPLDFTFVCPTEIIAFGDRQHDFDKINTQVIAASCDSLFTHLAWVNTPRSHGGLGDMKIPIVADFNKTVANQYGVLLPDGVPLRALFIISPTGVLRQITVNDLPVGRNVDEIIRLVKAFQFVDVHGEVCPANWQPGDITMKADPNGSLTYFEAVHGKETASVAAASTIEDVEDVARFNEIVKSNSLVVVDYWAPWCRNCLKISPLIARIAAERSDVKIIKVDITLADELAQAQEVDALPNIHFYKDGARVNNYKGSDAAAIEAAIAAHK